MSSIEPNGGCCQVDGGAEGACCLVMACGDGAVLREPGEKGLDQIARLGEVTIKGAGLGADAAGPEVWLGRAETRG